MDSGSIPLFTMLAMFCFIYVVFPVCLQPLMTMIVSCLSWYFFLSICIVCCFKCDRCLSNLEKFFPYFHQGF